MAQRSNASNSPGILSASSKDLGLLASRWKLVAGDSSPNEEASSSQVWQKYATTTIAGSTPAWEWNQEPDHLPSTWKHVANDLDIVETDLGWKETQRIGSN